MPVVATATALSACLGANPAIAATRSSPLPVLGVAVWRRSSNCPPRTSAAAILVPPMSTAKTARSEAAVTHDLRRAAEQREPRRILPHHLRRQCIDDQKLADLRRKRAAGQRRFRPG